MIKMKFIAFLAVLSLHHQILRATEIFVSPKGNNQNKGTKEQPLASLDAALRQARELRRLKNPVIKDGITIYLEGGVYPLVQPVFIRPEDSGTPQSPTIIKSLVKEQAILSGGINIQNWKKVTSKIAGLPAIAQGNIYVADVPTIADNAIDFRQLWVGGEKAIRAKSTPGVKMDRILAWNKATESCTIEIPKSGLKYTPGMEMFIHQWWAIAVLRIKEIKTKGNQAELFFYQPESKIQSEHPWPAPWISKETGNSAYYLSNALAFLDEPGEWFLDKANRKIYYWPKANQQLKKTEVVAPVLENLVQIQGTAEHPVSHIKFDGIAFQYSNWLRPSQQGHVPLQAGLFLLDAYKLKTPGTPDKAGLENQAWVGRPTAAVEAAYTHATSFQNCRFQYLSSTGLDYKRGNLQDTINGNLFKDIGGSGILAGVFSDDAMEAHLPYQPQDERELTRNLQITNNLITDVTHEDWGAVGIGAGFVKAINIANNEINEVSYTGISVGWGWTKTINAMSNNRIHANKIHHYAKQMYDVAGVYTLSAQPGSSITENVIDSIYKAPYAHLPEHWFYLYTDEGTSYFTVKDNWCPVEKFLQNANGPNNQWTNNGPMVKTEIKQAAGLQKSYQHLLKEQAKADKRWEINIHHDDKK
jgi:hypothetical protein